MIPENPDEDSVKAILDGLDGSRLKLWLLASRYLRPGIAKAMRCVWYGGWVLVDFRTWGDGIFRLNLDGKFIAANAVGEEVLAQTGFSEYALNQPWGVYSIMAQPGKPERWLSAVQVFGHDYRRIQRRKRVKTGAEHGSLVGEESMRCTFETKVLVDWDAQVNCGQL